MKLIKIELQYTDENSADTEIKYSVISSMFENPELIILLMPNGADSVQRRIFMQAKRILKEFKSAGRISFFATPDNFIKGDTVSQYVFEMFPELSGELPKIKNGCDFLVIRH